LLPSSLTAVGNEADEAEVEEYHLSEQLEVSVPYGAAETKTEPASAARAIEVYIAIEFGRRLMVDDL